VFSDRNRNERMFMGLGILSHNCHFENCHVSPGDKARDYMMSVGHNNDYKSSSSGHLDGFWVTGRTLKCLCDSAHNLKCHITSVVE
jgi:hypothetical protein